MSGLVEEGKKEQQEDRVRVYLGGMEEGEESEEWWIGRGEGRGGCVWRQVDGLGGCG